MGVYNDIDEARRATLDAKGKRRPALALSSSTTHTVETNTGYKTTVVREDPRALLAQFKLRWLPHALFYGEERLMWIYALTRELGSENPNEAAATQLAIARATLNQTLLGYYDKKAKTQRSWEHGPWSLLTSHHDPDIRGTFHSQRGSYASTRQDGYADHALAAAAVVDGRVGDIVRGGTSYFDVRSQLGGTQDGSSIRSPEELLAKWRDDGMAWVGPVPGVSRLMFFRREQDAGARMVAYRSALFVVQSIRNGNLGALDQAGGDPELAGAVQTAFLSLGLTQLGKVMLVL